MVVLPLSLTRSATITIPCRRIVHQYSCFGTRTALGVDGVRQLLHSRSARSVRRDRDRSSSRRATECLAFFVPVWPKTTTAPWGIWAALTVASALGLWSEKTRLGKQLSGALVATLVGLAFSNLGLIPSDAPYVYNVVTAYLLPLAVPLLLFTADIRRVVLDTGLLLRAFLIGSLGTVVGTVAAWKLLPLYALGADGWKVAAALAARHIGGAVNYVGVCETLDVSASAQAAGLAADNLISAVYFASIYALARSIPPDAGAVAGGSGQDLPVGEGIRDGRNIQVLEGATAIALSCVICFVGNSYAKSIGSSSIPVVTAITVLLATFFPTVLSPLAPSAEGIAAILLQVFFATVGAAGNIGAVISTAPSLFLYSLLQIFIHLGFTMAVGSLMGFSRRDILLASNANVGGPTTAAGMAATKGWKSSLVPALLVGVFGYATATFIAVALGRLVIAKL